MIDREIWGFSVRTTSSGRFSTTFRKKEPEIIHEILKIIIISLKLLNQFKLLIKISLES